MPDPTLLQKTIGCAFSDQQLLALALTHRSYANEHRLSRNNERLEFLGDAVLNLIISEHLVRISPGSTEGDLSRIRASVVSEPALASIARGIGLGGYLLLGRGEDQSGGRDKDSVLSDSMEALLAAVYLDAGKEQAEQFVLRFFSSLVGAALETQSASDHKTELQELCQERLKVLPEYRIVSESGPDHQKQFTVEISVKGAAYGRGSGRSKKEAEQRAAREALEQLRDQEPGVRG